MRMALTGHFIHKKVRFSRFRLFVKIFYKNRYQKCDFWLQNFLSFWKIFLKKYFEKILKFSEQKIRVGDKIPGKVENFRWKRLRIFHSCFILIVARAKQTRSLSDHSALRPCDTNAAT